MMQQTPEKTEAPVLSRPRMAWRRMVIGLLLALLLAGLPLAGLWIWRERQISASIEPSPPSAAPVELVIAEPAANALAQLTLRLGELETETARLKTAATVPPGASGADVTRLDDAVRALSGSLTAIDTTLNALGARLTALEAAQAAQPLGGEARRLSYALGLRELERALRGPGPFEVELDTLEKLLDGGSADPAIAALRPHAATGIPSIELLMARFDATAAAIVRADAASGVAPGWAGRAYAFVMSLVMIRPLGEREGEGAPARVARAQLRLEKGDLAGAVAEIGALRGAAAQAGAAWLDGARARLTVDEAMAQLTARLTQQLNSAAIPAQPALPGAPGE